MRSNRLSYFATKESRIGLAGCSHDGDGQRYPYYVHSTAAPTVSNPPVRTTYHSSFAPILNASTVLKSYFAFIRAVPVA